MNEFSIMIKCSHDIRPFKTIYYNEIEELCWNGNSILNRYVIQNKAKHLEPVFDDLYFLIR